MKTKNSKKKIEKISKDLVYLRLILGDRNCFYGAFLFSLLELWILQKNINISKNFFVIYIIDKKKNFE
jgi:hypothetical protein